MTVAQALALLASEVDDPHLSHQRSRRGDLGAASGTDVDRADPWALRRTLLLAGGGEQGTRLVTRPGADTGA